MRNPILDLIMLVAATTAIVGSYKLMKSAKSKLASEQISQDGLSHDEKNKVYALALLNPVWAGIIFYFGWRKNLPAKAKEANNITFIAFALWILLSLIIGWPLKLSA